MQVALRGCLRVSVAVKRLMAMTSQKTFHWLTVSEVQSIILVAGSMAACKQKLRALHPDPHTTGRERH